MNRFQISRALFVCALLAVFSVSADAQPTPGYSYSGGFASVSPGSTNTAGHRFLVHEDISVEALGIIDFGNDGLSQAHAVGLWTDAGALLASVTVPAGTGGTLVGGFRYAAIAPVGLTAGQTYRVGAQPLDEVYYNGVSYASPAAITILDQSTTYGGIGPSLSFPGDFTFSPGSAIANFQFSIPPILDCNDNGIPDGEELDGNDCNNNGIPDDCDLPGDIDGDGDVDFDDLNQLLANYGGQVYPTP